MRYAIFIPGAIIFLISFIVWSYDQPKIDLISQGIGQLALLNKDVREKFMILQEEVFYAKIGMIVGIIIMIPGIVLKKKKINTQN